MPSFTTCIPPSLNDRSLLPCAISCWKEGLLSNSTPVHVHAYQLAKPPKQVQSKAWEHLNLGRRRLAVAASGFGFWKRFLLKVSNVSPAMAVDDSNLYSRTKNKLNSSQNDYKSSRRSSLPPELLVGNDIRGRHQRNIKNLEPVHLRRPKKRPSIIPGRNCLNLCLPVKNNTRTIFHLLQSDVLHLKLTWDKCKSLK